MTLTLAVAYIQNNEGAAPEIGNVQRADTYEHAYDIAVKMVREFYELKKLKMVFNDEVCTTDEELREYFVANDMVCFYDMISDDEPRSKITVQVIAIE